MGGMLHVLTDFEITMEFLWIHEGEQGRADVEEKITKLRTNNWPKYKVHWVSIQTGSQRSSSYAYQNTPVSGLGQRLFPLSIVSHTKIHSFHIPAHTSVEGLDVPAKIDFVAYISPLTWRSIRNNRPGFVTLPE